MDFVEKIFGFAPDGGNGTFELALFVIPIVLAILVVVFRKRLRT